MTDFLRRIRDRIGLALLRLNRLAERVEHAIAREIDR